MADTNTWVLIGRLTRDADCRYLGGGSTFVANFSLAVEVGWGERKHTNFWKVKFFGKGAEAISQWLLKGKQVSVTGNADIEAYQNSSGLDVKETVMVAKDVQLLASPAGGGGGARNPSGNHGDDVDFGRDNEEPVY